MKSPTWSQEPAPLPEPDVELVLVQEPDPDPEPDVELVVVQEPAPTPDPEPVAEPESAQEQEDNPEEPTQELTANDNQDLEADEVDAPLEAVESVPVPEDITDLPDVQEVSEEPQPEQPETGEELTETPPDVLETLEGAQEQDTQPETEQEQDTELEPQQEQEQEAELESETEQEQEQETHSDPEPEPPHKPKKDYTDYTPEYDFTSGTRYVDAVSTKTEFDKMLEQLADISRDLLAHEVEKFAVKFTGKFQGDFDKAEADAKKYEAFLGGYITNAAMTLYDNGYPEAAIKKLEQAKSILEARKKLEEEKEAISSRVEENDDAVDLSDILGLIGD